MTFIKYLGSLGVEPPRANLLSTVELRFWVRNAFWLYIVFSVTCEMLFAGDNVICFGGLNGVLKNRRITLIW